MAAGFDCGNLIPPSRVNHASKDSKAIIAVDDLETKWTQHRLYTLGAVIRSMCGQAWIATRLPSVAEIFEPNEVIRLSRTLDGTRTPHQGTVPTNKAEARAAGHWQRNLLPTFTYHSVIVVEGPHDLAALHSLAIRLCKEGEACMPAGHGVAMISAGATGGGGYSAVLRLTALAKEMGMYAIAVVDGDINPEAREFISAHVNEANTLIRYPDNCPSNMPLPMAFATSPGKLTDVSTAMGLNTPTSLDQLTEIKQQ